MILYHGTDKSNLKNILAKGLLPRKETGKKVYTGAELSNENFVYLSRYNPVAHAYTIDNLPTIIKVDVDPQTFYPDEDYIERMIYFNTGVKVPMCEIDVTDYKEYWKDSLQYFGSVAVPSVSKEHIIDYVCLDPKDFNYHCGLGAQGNSNTKDLFEFRIETNGKKYIQRLEMLFSDGWEAVKKDILLEKPSSVLKMWPPISSITYKTKKYDVLLFNKGIYVCDEWIDNVSDYPVFSKKQIKKNSFLQALVAEHNKLLLIPATEVPNV